MRLAFARLVPQIEGGRPAAAAAPSHCLPCAQPARPILMVPQIEGGSRPSFRGRAVASYATRSDCVLGSNELAKLLLPRSRRAIASHVMRSACAHLVPQIKGACQAAAAAPSHCMPCAPMVDTLCRTFPKRRSTMVSHGAAAAPSPRLPRAQTACHCAADRKSRSAKLPRRHVVLCHVLGLRAPRAANRGRQSAKLLLPRRRIVCHAFRLRPPRAADRKRQPSCCCWPSHRMPCAQTVDTSCRMSKEAVSHGAAAAPLHQMSSAPLVPTSCCRSKEASMLLLRRCRIACRA